MSDVLNIQRLTESDSTFQIRPSTDEDKDWMRELLKQYWASTRVVTRGKLHQCDQLPGLVAWSGEDRVGLVTYRIEGEQCEIVTHNSIGGHGGVGTLLLAEVRRIARQAGCTRLWLVTSNDNTPAIRFYQRRDFDLLAVHRHAIDQARSLKPEIPEVGMFGIRIRHEVELEYLL